MSSPVFEKPVVYVVDDNDSLCKVLIRLLNVVGYEVRAYVSVGDFVISERDNRCGCVLLDVWMFGLSGLDLQEALVKEDEPLFVIFLIVYGDVPMSVHVMKVGAVDFLT